jgi:hypothetical protein
MAGETTCSTYACGLPALVGQAFSRPTPERLSELRSDAQGGAFLENSRSPGDRSLIGVADTSIGAATVRERFAGGGAFHHSLEAPLGVMSNLCH